ncbi:hypothetical protein MHBO_002994 [Bonamia ostreae]|uniref:Nucleoporin Nup54 alpha-helical domain-containing protein n=1 Tax=Bonamia ostreae TaxID=126728 RepID=A0ABV2AP55_9EUKA
MMAEINNMYSKEQNQLSGIMTALKHLFRRINPTSPNNLFQAVLYDNKPTPDGQEFLCPPNADVIKWQEGVSTNPDDTRLTAIHIDSFASLKERVALQNTFKKIFAEKALKMQSEINAFEQNQLFSVDSPLKELISSFSDLSPRLIRAIAQKERLYSKVNLNGFDPEEDLKNLFNRTNNLKLQSVGLIERLDKLNENLEMAEKKDLVQQKSLDESEEFDETDFEIMFNALKSYQTRLDRVEQNIDQIADELDLKIAKKEE